MACIGVAMDDGIAPIPEHPEMATKEIVPANRPKIRTYSSPSDCVTIGS
jgi:hypothetical protein